MRALLLGLALVSAPAMAAAERRTVGIGEVLKSIDSDRRENVRLAKISAPIERTVYLTEKLRLPAGEELEWSDTDRGYCSAETGYISSYGTETGICLSDSDADGRFETVSGVAIVKPVRLKTPVAFTARIGSVTTPSAVQKRIVYLGGTASEARFSYREFTRDGMARPAFTEDLTVPLGAFPALVNLKGLKLTIHGQGPSGLDVEVGD